MMPGILNAEQHKEDFPKLQATNLNDQLFMAICNTDVRLGRERA